MSSRFNSSSLHQRDTRSALFSNYDSRRAPSNSPSSRSPAPAYGGNPYNHPQSDAAARSSTPNGAFGAYPGAGVGGQGQSGYFRSSTPGEGGGGGARGGGYSDAMLSELESQNEEQVSGLSGKVKMLKELTVAIGDEIKSSTSLADQMNDGFSDTRIRLRGTMNRMLRMAERTGVGWKAWLAFFSAVILLFWYVWL